MGGMSGGGGRQPRGEALSRGRGEGGGGGSKGECGYAFPDAPLCISRLNYLLRMHVNLIL